MKSKIKLEDKEKKIGHRAIAAAIRYGGSCTAKKVPTSNERQQAQSNTQKLVDQLLR